MNRVLAIAFNTFKEAVRNRILYIILFFALILIGASGIAASLAISDKTRIVKNLGFASINLFGVAIAVFVGVSMVYNELEKRTIYTIVSKPIDRWQFLLGKYFGLLLTIYVNILIMTMFFLYMLHYNFYQTTEIYDYVTRMDEAPGALDVILRSIKRTFISLVAWNNYEATSNVMPVIFATTIEMAIMTAFAIFYSSFSTPTLSMFFTVMTFIAGRLNEDIIGYAEYVLAQAQRAGESTPPAYYLANVAAIITPNLEAFNKTVQQAVWQSQVVIEPWTLVYGVAYAAGIMAMSMLIFSKRNFK